MSKIQIALYKWRFLPWTHSRTIVSFLAGFAFAYLLVSLVAQPRALGEAEARNILSVQTSLLATILAIVVSITTLGIQYMASTYTPRGASGFLRDPLVVGFLSTYAIAILLNLTSLTFNFPQTPDEFVFLSFFIFGFSLSYLVVYPFYLTDKLQPERTIDEIRGRLPKGFYHFVTEGGYWTAAPVEIRRPLLLLEQILIRAVRQNDYDTYTYGLHTTWQITEDLIRRAVGEMKENKDHMRFLRRVKGISDFSLRLVEQLKVECFETNNAFLVIPLMEMLGALIEQLHELRASSPLRDVYDQLEELGLLAIRRGMPSLSERFGYTLRRIIEIESVSAKKEVSPFTEWDPEKHLTEDEKMGEMIDRDFYEFLEYRRLDFMEKMTREASAHGYRTVVHSIIGAYSHLLDEVLKIENRRQRRWLTSRVLASLGNSYSSAADAEMHHSGDVVGGLPERVSAMTDLNVETELRKRVTERLCGMALISVKKGDWMALHDLGYSGRGLSRTDHIGALLEVVETLAEALLYLRSEAGEEAIPVTPEMAEKELKSIRDWREHEHSSVKERIDTILS